MLSPKFDNWKRKVLTRKDRLSKISLYTPSYSRRGVGGATPMALTTCPDLPILRRFLS